MFAAFRVMRQRFRLRLINWASHPNCAAVPATVVACTGTGTDAAAAVAAAVAATAVAGLEMD